MGMAIVFLVHVHKTRPSLMPLLMTYLMVYFIPLTSTKLHNENLMGQQGCRLYVEKLFAPTENIGV